MFLLRPLFQIQYQISDIFRNTSCQEHA
jgi:hypothetical protein